ncbi:MAG: hypothetical protein H6832_17615, partial [Planctomycetes bacterium]|nr:hypothetical protein [Planctomycetota bacterium]
MGRTTEWLYRKALDAAELLDGDPDDLPDVAALKAAQDAYFPTKTPMQQASIRSRGSSKSNRCSNAVPGRARSTTGCASSTRTKGRVVVRHRRREARLDELVVGGEVRDAMRFALEAFRARLDDVHALRRAALHAGED